MLPALIADQMKGGRYVVADEYKQVSILYSDIKGFTKYSAGSTPENVVTLLSKLFSVFDKLTDEHKVFKVQT